LKNPTPSPDKPEDSLPGSLSAEIKRLFRIWPLVEQALSQFDDKLLREAWSRTKQLREGLRERIEGLLERSRGTRNSSRKKGARRELEYLQNLLQISRYLFDFMKETREKIDHDIIFSPRGYSQLIGLWETAFEIIRQEADLPGTEAGAVTDAINRRCAEVTNLIIEYDLDHEDRLIRGICPSNASSIFLNMLDAIRGVIRCLDSIADLG